MAVIRFSRAGIDSRQFRAELDGHLLTYTDDTAERDLAPGPHAFSWLFRSLPGTKYEVAITAPEANVWSYAQTLDSTQIDMGVHWFLVEDRR